MFLLNIPSESEPESESICIENKYSTSVHDTFVKLASSNMQSSLQKKHLTNTQTTYDRQNIKTKEKVQYLINDG